MKENKIFLNTCVGPNCPEENKVILEQDGKQIEKPVHGCSEYIDGKLTEKKKCSDCKHIESTECPKDHPETEISDGYCEPCAEEKEKEIRKFFAEKKD